MTVHTTTAIYTVWSAITDLLTATTFPQSASNPDPVGVWFGDYDLPPDDVPLSNERIVVASFVDDSQQEWGPIGQYRRDDSFSVFVYIISAIPGQSTLQAAARLEELTSSVELAIRSINSDRTSTDSLDAFAPFRPWWLDFAKVLPLIAPDPNGAIGRAEITLRCKFRISGPPVT